MTVSSISLTSTIYANQQTYAQNNFQQICQEFDELESALHCQDLDGANTAYSTLYQILPDPLTGSQTNTAQNSNGQGGAQHRFQCTGSGTSIG